jgi:aspartate/methionine/tyrosine aminotransferase
MSRLPDFRLETYFSKWEFNTKYNLCASDSESLSFKELLEFSRDKDKALLDNMSFGYTETYGDKKLREIIASLYENSSYRDILTFSGAEEAIYVSMKSILDKDDHAIVFAPNYQSAQTLPQSICDVTVLNLNSNEDWNINLDQLKSSIQKNTKLISINFPHNPTGKIISKSDQNEIINICRENNIYLFSDEIYRMMERDIKKRLPQVSDLYEKGISLNGMSKSYGMPGIRMGWVNTNDHKLLDIMERMKHYLSICNSAPNEILSIMALNSRDKILERANSIIRKNLTELNKFFNDYKELFSWNEPDGGCISYPKYLGSDGVENFCEKLIKENSVLLLPSSVYLSVNKNGPKNHFRIGFGRKNMISALRELEKFVNKNYSF